MLSPRSRTELAASWANDSNLHARVLTRMHLQFLGGIDTYQDGLCYTMSCRADNSCKWSAVLPPAEGCVNVTRGNFICKYGAHRVVLPSCAMPWLYCICGGRVRRWLVQVYVKRTTSWFILTAVPYTLALAVVQTRAWSS